MKDKTRKRSRKTKLVPREYSDSDDEHIAKMQDEIEQAIAQINPLSILKKLEPKQRNDIQFSVKVEVEEVENITELQTVDVSDSELPHTEDIQDSEVTHTEDSQDSELTHTEDLQGSELTRKEDLQELGIQIHSVRSLLEPSQDNHTTISKTYEDISDTFYYTFDEDEIREDFDILCKETTSLADKIIEIHLKNSFGKKQFLIAQSSLDQRLQKMFKKWLLWHRTCPGSREGPLMYMCFECNQGWWNFYEFRDHLRHSHVTLSMAINIDRRSTQAMVIAVRGDRMVADSAELPVFESKCWRCNKDHTIHLRSTYICDGCSTKFSTCTNLFYHEGECDALRRKILNLNDEDHKKTAAVYRCPVCIYKDWDENRFIFHMTNYHRVRSDQPIHWTVKTCTKCNLQYQEALAHYCCQRKTVEVCRFCSERFQKVPGLALHLHNSVADYKCRLCDKVLQRSCMEAEHMLEHSENYIQIYKCAFCPEQTYFIHEHAANSHRLCMHVHGKRAPYYKIIVPKKFLQKLEPTISGHEKKKRCSRKVYTRSVTPNVSNDIPSPDTQSANLGGASIDMNQTNAEHDNFNKLYQDLVGTEKETDVATCSPRAPDTRCLIDAELGVEITIINKSVVQELSDAVIAEFKAKERQRDQNNPVKPVNNVILPVTKTYTNKKKSCANETDRIEVEVEVGGVEVEVGGVEVEVGGVEVEVGGVEVEVGGVEVEVGGVEVEVGGVEVEVGGVEVEVDGVEVEVDNNEVKKEIEDVKSEFIDELMDTNEVDVNFEVKSEKVDSVVNYLDVKFDSLCDDDVPAVEGCEVEIKEESDDFREDEPDIISWDMNSSEEVEDADDNISSNYGSKDYRKNRNINGVIYAKHYGCTKCNKKWMSLYKYLAHFSHHNYKPKTCPQCMKVCRNSLTRHVSIHVNRLFVMTRSIERSKLKTQRNYRCRKCKKALSGMDFFKHWESHLDITDGEVFEHPSPVDMSDKPHLIEMLELLQGHDAGETWKLKYCQVCDKKIDRQNDCKRHYIEHLLMDAYKEKDKYGELLCQICGTGFQRKDNYKRHMRDHASLPLYICEICDKTFSDSSNFCKHKKVHNMAVLVCDICKKKFNNKQFLIKHIQMHELIQPINCKTCDKVFYTPSSYNKHLKANRARFSCIICNIVYYSLKDKWDHMWQVHKERKYKADCPICDKSFRKFQDVRHHLRVEHDKQDYVLYNPYGKKKIYNTKKMAWEVPNAEGRNDGIVVIEMQ